jgi:PAS domain S-box-containing protein
MLTKNATSPLDPGTVLHGLQEAVIIVDLEQRVCFCNAFAMATFGWRSEDVVNRELLSFISDDSRDDAMQMFAEAMAGRQSGGTWDVPLLGETKRLDCSATPFLAADGTLAGILITAHSTPLKQVKAASAVKESEAQFRTLVEHALTGVYIVQNQRLVYCNPELTRILGRDKATLLALPSLLDVVVDEDRERVASLMRQRVERGSGAAQYSFRIARPDGSIAEIEIHGAVTDYGGRPALLGTALDVTEQRRATEELRRSETRYRTLIEEAKDIIFTCDVDGRITTLNHAFEEITGHRTVDWIGRHFGEILEPESVGKAAHHFKEILARHGTSLRESKLRAADGRTILIEGTARPLMNDGRIVGTIGISRDITERRRLENIVERSSRFTALGRLAATLAHEFNNVLMGMQTTIDVMQRRNDRDDVRDNLATLRKAIDRGSHVTREVLRFTRIAEPRFATVDVEDLLRTSIEEIRSLTSPHIDVQVQSPAAGTLYVSADSEQLQQVFANLALNARDAMPDGGTLIISATKYDSASPDGKGMAAISFQDNGCGMGSDTTSLIFEPLFTTKRNSGTGLGLATAQQIVDRHGGRIDLETEPGHGARFTIVLPVVPAEQQPSETNAPGDHARVRRLLLVEDDELVAEGLAAVLELEGIEVAVATVGREAEPAVERFGPEAVVLDLNLPDIDGREVYRRLMKRWPDLPVIISSGHGDASAIKELTAGGRAAFLLKPYDIETLLSTVEDVTGHR